MKMHLIVAETIFGALMTATAWPALACTLMDPPETMTADRCQYLEDLGTINVMCPWNTATREYVDSPFDLNVIWANPNDDCDDSAAIRSALFRAKGGPGSPSPLRFKTVLFPAGKRDANHRSTPYLVDLLDTGEGFNVGGVRIMGQANIHNAKAVIKYNGPGITAGVKYDLPPASDDNSAAHKMGALFFSTNTPHQMEDLFIDGKGIDGVGSVDYGIYMYNASSAQTYVRNVAITNTKQVGLYLDITQLAKLDRVSAQGNVGDGIVAASANGTIFSKTQATDNGRHGVVVVRNKSGPSGGVTLHHGNVERNGGHGVFVLETLTPVVVRSFWVEKNGEDGLRAQGANHVHFLYNNIIGQSKGTYLSEPEESLNHAIALHDCKACSVRGNQVANAGTIKHYEDIWLAGDSSYPYISDNIYDAGNGVKHDLGGGNFFDIVIVNDTERVRTAQHTKRAWSAPEPPALGHWTKGDILWNSDPEPNEPAGWMYTGSGSGTTWLEIGKLKR